MTIVSFHKYDVIINKGLGRINDRVSLEFNYNLFIYKDNKIINELSYYNIVAWYYSRCKKKFAIDYKFNNNLIKKIIFHCDNSDPLINEIRKNIKQIINLYDCDYKKIKSFFN